MNNKAFIGLAAAGLAVFVLVPGAGRSLGPLLLAAACPLSMIFMMRGMGANSRKGAAAGSEPQQQPASAYADEVAALRARVTELEAGRRAAEVEARRHRARPVGTSSPGAGSRPLSSRGGSPAPEQRTSRQSG